MASRKEQHQSLHYSKDSQVPEGHHPRGTTLREALRGNLPLRGFCGGLSEGSAGVLWGLSEGSEGLCGGPRDFPRVFGGSDPMLLTLGNCWKRCCKVSCKSYRKQFPETKETVTVSPIVKRGNDGKRRG